MGDLLIKDIVSARPEIGKNEISRHQKFKIPLAATQA
jgi:hypothetical protein